MVYTIKMELKLLLHKIMFEEPPIYRSSRYQTTLHIIQNIGILSFEAYNFIWSLPQVIKLSIIPFSSCGASHSNTTSPNWKSSVFVLLSKYLFHFILKILSSVKQLLPLLLQFNQLIHPPLSWMCFCFLFLYKFHHQKAQGTRKIHLRAINQL